MKTFTRLTLSLSLLGLTGSIPIMATAAQQPPVTSIKANQEASFLFVLSAKTGVITKSDAGYTLTLQGMDDKVLYFSDRPVRQAGFIAMTQFMGDWANGNNSFAVNPPNAAIVHTALKTNTEGVAQAIAVELTHPVAVKGGWSYQLTDLQGKLGIGTYDKVSVFVDNYNIRLNGTRTGIIGRSF